MPRKDKSARNEYHRAWYAAGGYKYYAKKKVRRRDSIRNFLKSLKESQPCVDCQQFYPHYVMDFDHLEDKVINISAIANLGWSLERMQTELRKCDLVCANCHRIRTYQRRLSG